MVKKRSVYILVVGMCLLMVTSVLAAPLAYSLGWWTVDAGGGTSVGGIYSLSGSIGQPEAGSMSGSGYQLVGGFWGGAAGAAPPLAKAYLPLVVR